MPKLPRLSGPELIKILRKIGFEEKRQKGSHIFLEKYIDGKRKGLVVPNHKEIDTQIPQISPFLREFA